MTLVGKVAPKSFYANFKRSLSERTQYYSRFWRGLSKVLSVRIWWGSFNSKEADRRTKRRKRTRITSKWSTFNLFGDALRDDDQQDQDRLREVSDRESTERKIQDIVLKCSRTSCSRVTSFKWNLRVSGIFLPSKLRNFWSWPNDKTLRTPCLSWFRFSDDRLTVN